MVRLIPTALKRIFRKTIEPREKEILIRNSAIKILKNALKKCGINLKEEEIDRIIKVPSSVEMGDYTFPCIRFSEKLKYDSHEFALMLREKIGNFPRTDFEDIQTSGAYVNFFLNRKSLAKEIVQDILIQREKYGKGKEGKRKITGRKEKVIIDFSCLYIGKYLEMDHLRSIIIGNSIANICKFEGFNPILVSYLKGNGIDLAKLIFGFKKFGSEKKLQSNPIKHLTDIYKKVTKEYDDQSIKWLKKTEEMDRGAVMLWRAFKELSLEDIEKLHRFLGIKFNENLWELEAVKNIENVINQLEKKKLLEKRKGSIVVNLNKYKLGICEIKKKNDTYTQIIIDISEAIVRYNRYKFGKMIYGVGKEELHFKQVFKILELMGCEWAKKCFSVKHGFYLNKNKKKLKINKENNYFIEEMIKESAIKVKKNIEKKSLKISKSQLEKESIAFVKDSIFYMSLRNLQMDIGFDIKFILDKRNIFEYIKNSYERANFILERTKEIDDFEVYYLKSQEMELVKKLSQFKEVVLNSYKNLNPSLIANYSHELAQSFNRFCDSCPINSSEDSVYDLKQNAFRLALVESFRQVLRNSLKISGIKI